MTLYTLSETPPSSQNKRDALNSKSGDCKGILTAKSNFTKRRNDDSSLVDNNKNQSSHDDDDGRDDTVNASNTNARRSSNAAAAAVVIPLDTDGGNDTTGAADISFPHNNSKNKNNSNKNNNSNNGSDDGSHMTTYKDKHEQVEALRALLAEQAEAQRRVKERLSRHSQALNAAYLYLFDDDDDDEKHSEKYFHSFADASRKDHRHNLSATASDIGMNNHNNDANNTNKSNNISHNNNTDSIALPMIWAKGSGGGGHVNSSARGQSGRYLFHNSNRSDEDAPGLQEYRPNSPSHRYRWTSSEPQQQQQQFSPYSFNHQESAGVGNYSSLPPSPSRFRNHRSYQRETK